MKAMILAAGLGTRLKPLTDRIPKALVPVEGVPMLERVILSLKKRGFDSIVVNVHHFADQVIEFLDRKIFGIRIEISDERDELLDTGGALVKAFDRLFRDGEKEVLVHNVDILSNADFKSLMCMSPYSEKNEKSGGRLLVSSRDSTRKLIFDDRMILRGWHDLRNDKFRPESFIPVRDYKEYAFSGIYTVRKESVEEMKELFGETKFSVMDYFLDERRSWGITGLKQEDLILLDIGKPATLSQASDILKVIDRNY